MNIKKKTQTKRLKNSKKNWLSKNDNDKNKKKNDRQYVSPQFPKLSINGKKKIKNRHVIYSICSRNLKLIPNDARSVNNK